MNIAIILSGGVGSRMGNSDTPKQYLSVNGKTIISYCLNRFEGHRLIDKIIVIAAKEWHSLLSGYGYSKIAAIGINGPSRQHSILNGLNAALNISSGKEDIVIIHDGVRPLVSDKIIDDCIEAIGEYDGAMPGLRIKDTVYQSQNGDTINNVLNRSELFAGQSPESFRLADYYAIHKDVSDAQLHAISGSSVIAFQHGLRVKITTGEERNFKITTKEDLTLFRRTIENE